MAASTFRNAQVPELRQELIKRELKAPTSWHKQQLVDALIDTLEAEAEAAQGNASEQQLPPPDAARRDTAHRVALGSDVVEAADSTAKLPQAARNGAAASAALDSSASSAARNGAHQGAAGMTMPLAVPFGGDLIDDSNARPVTRGGWASRATSGNGAAAPAASSSPAAAAAAGPSSQQPGNPSANGSGDTEQLEVARSAQQTDTELAAYGAERGASGPWPTAGLEAQKTKEPVPAIDFRKFPCSIDTSMLEGQDAQQIVRPPLLALFMRATCAPAGLHCCLPLDVPQACARDCLMIGTAVCTLSS